MITKRPYRMLCDNPRVHDFLSEIYTKDCKNGMPAPFLDYSQSYPDFEAAMSHRIELWEDEGMLVAMAWYEIKLDKALISLRPGYEALIDELLDHAEQYIHKPGEPAEFWLRSKQTAVRQRLAERGYAVKNQWPMKCYDFSKGDIPYELPEGNRFLDNENEAVDFTRLHDCIWRGFDHGDRPDDDVDFQIHFTASPYYRDELPAIVVNDAGDYVCYAGMWHDERNKLAYMEPLCTVPDCRKKGIAAATMAMLVKRMRELGCTHMTGGANEFYTRIGFEVEFMEEVWGKA